MLPLSRRALGLVLLGGAAIAFVAGVVEVHDPDMFHHLALGREIARGGLPAQEPFLYPLRGATTGPPSYWLGSLAIHGWHALLGDGGLALLPALLGAIAFAVLLLDASPRSGRHGLLTLAAAALPLALALAAFRHRATARPETFGLVFLAFTLWAVRRLEDGRTWPFAALPALALVWANVHPSVLAGLAIAALFVAVGVALRLAARVAGKELPGTPTRGQLAAAALVLALSAAATLANPSASSPLRSALAFAASVVFPAGGAPAAFGGGETVLPYLRALVKEMRPPTLADWAQPHGILLALAAGSFLLRGRRIRPRDAVTFAVLAVLATRSLRFMILFSIVSAPFAARNLGEALAALPRVAWRLPLRASLGCAASAGAAALLAAQLLFPAPGLAFGTGLRRGAYPVRAADYLQAIGFRGRVYNAFAFGGYLAWRGIAPYQDGRGLLPEGGEEASLLGPAAGARFDALDREYRFDALVLERPEPVPGAPPVATSGDWIVDGARFALVAFDDGGLLFLRRDGAHAERAARDAYGKARPAYAAYRWEPAEVPQILEEYRRSVREAPACVVCRYFQGAAALAAGRPEEALEASGAALGGRGPELVNPLRVAARANEALGRAEEARRLYARLLATGLDDAGARRGLARLALAAGDLDGARDALRANVDGPRPAAGDLALALEVARRAGRGGEVARLEALLARHRAEGTAEELRRRGIAAFEAGDVAAAAAWLGRAVEANASSAPAHSELGQALLAMGRAEEAARRQRRALELDPAYVPAHYGLALALGARGDRAGAATAYRRCIELEPAGVWAIRAGQQLRAMGAR